MSERDAENWIEVVGGWFVDIKSGTEWGEMISRNWIEQSVLSVDRVEIISEAIKLFWKIEMLVGIRSWRGNREIVSKLKFSDEKGRLNFRR